MSSGVYVLYDKIAELYSLPLVFKNDTLAQRSFELAMLNISDKTKQKSDYELYKLGEYDENYGKLTILENKIFIMSGSSVKEGEE